jgi:hypothetical protein
MDCFPRAAVAFSLCLEPVVLNHVKTPENVPDDRLAILGYYWKKDDNGTTRKTKMEIILFGRS